MSNPINKNKFLNIIKCQNKSVIQNDFSPNIYFFFLTQATRKCLFSTNLVCRHIMWVDTRALMYHGVFYKYRECKIQSMYACRISEHLR